MANKQTVVIPSPWLKRTLVVATLFAMIVVAMGAYTRLVHGGLGCPDWPGCYGHLGVPQGAEAISQAEQAFPNAPPVEAAKAWPEMIHRYIAGTLGLFILCFGLWSLIKRRHHPHTPIAVPIYLLVVLLGQAVLGMWTVTWKLHPLVVMGHLLGGMTITSLLWWTTLQTPPSPALPLTSAHIMRPQLKRLRWLCGVGIALVFAQIMLGGWTSANYASLICPDFPACRGSLWPAMDFKHAFNIFAPIGVNYQGGVLGNMARITIHMMHRYGGAIVGMYIVGLTLYSLYIAPTGRIKRVAALCLGLLVTQIALGIANVVYLLPLPIAVAHNSTALLLLLSVETLLQRTNALLQSTT